MLQAELETDQERERQFVADLQATRQRSRSLLGTPEATRGGIEAWQEFYARYNPWIRRAVRARRVRTCDLDDCVQDVWTLLLCKLDRFDCQRRPCRFRLWLLTMIQRQVARFSRRSVSDRGTSLGQLESYADRADLSPAAVCQRHRTMRLVREVFAQLRERLPAVSFKVMELRWLKEESVPDIAATLGITREQVWYRLYRARNKLCELLKMRGLDDAYPSEKGW